VKRHEQCLEIMDKLRNESKDRVTIYDEGLQLGLFVHCRDEFYDYKRIGELHKKMYYQSVKMYFESMLSLSGAELEAPIQDAKFLRAVECFEKCIELSVPISNRGEAAQIAHHLVELYALYDTLYYQYIMHLYNEIGTEMLSSPLSPSILQSNNTNPSLLQHEAVTKLAKEIAAYLRLPDSLEKFTQMTSIQHATMLYTRERNIESYISTPLDDLKFPYIHLQEHYYRKARLLHILVVNYKAGELEQGAQFCRWKAFMCAERQRTRAMLYQLGPNEIKDAVSHELRRFENDDNAAMEAIQKDCAALFKKNTVFVMYSRMVDEEKYLIYVIDQVRYWLQFNLLMIPRQIFLDL
jgi:hypothetical protein